MRLPLPAWGRTLPAWELPHVSPEEAALLRDLEAQVSYISQTRVGLSLRWRSLVSVHVVYTMASWSDLRRDSNLRGGRLRVTRHSEGGCRIVLSRAQTAALRRCAAPYLEGARQEDLLRVTESRARMEESDRLSREEDALRLAEDRRRDREWLASLPDAERERVLRRRGEELDALLRRIGAR